MNIRSYQPSDYNQVSELYKRSELYGGQFDENRDSEEKLARKIEIDSEAILVAEQDGKIVGTVSLIEDGRVALLFRFAVEKNALETVKALYEKASSILQKRGHKQVLVYAPANNSEFEKRYKALNFIKGENYTCFWKDL